MNIEEMNLLQINERLAALDLEVRAATTVELIESATKEKTDLIERKSELEDLEQRKQTALNIVAGTVTPKILEARKETNKMEFKGMDKKEIQDSVEYRNLWLKALQGNSMSEVEQRDYTSAASSSGAAVPTMTSDMLFTKMSKVAPMLSEITLLRVAGNVSFTTEGVRNAAVQHTQNAAITAATDTMIAVSLTGYEYNKLLYVSKTVQTMSINAFEGWLTDMIAEDVALVIEDKIINGTGSSQPKGIAVATTWATASNLVEVTGTFVITYSDVLSMLGKLPARYGRNAKFLCSNAMAYQGLAAVKDTNGRPILVNDATGEYPFRVMGKPVLVSDSVAAKTLFLGDYKKVIGNLAQDVVVEKDASAGFASNSIAYRGGAIFDCTIALVDAFVKLTTNTY